MGTRDFRAQSKDMLLLRDLLLRHSVLNMQPVSLPWKGPKEPTLMSTHKPLGAVIITSVLATAPGKSLSQSRFTTEHLKNEGVQQEFIHSLTAWK